VNGVLKTMFTQNGTDNHFEILPTARWKYPAKVGGKAFWHPDYVAPPDILLHMASPGPACFRSYWTNNTNSPHWQSSFDSAFGKPEDFADGNKPAPIWYMLLLSASSYVQGLMMIVTREAIDA
jgi:hypothetical protein